MKNSLFVSLTLHILMILSCNPAEEKSFFIKDYQEISGIYVEQFDSTVTDDSRYNYDNKIFKESSTFIYELNIISKEGDSLLFEVPERENLYNAPWNFVNANEKELDNVVKKVRIETLKGNQMFAKYNPDYYQTVILYEYLTEDDQLNYNSASGVIENSKNIWAHPPRDFYLNILELNPFPFVKFPLEAGKNWQWQLTIGSQWGDERWKTWKGNIENNYDYTIVGKEELRYQNETLNCWIIKGEAVSKLGETSLLAYYHPKYGFVKLDYTNIDGSKTQLELIEMN